MGLNLVSLIISRHRVSVVCLVMREMSVVFLENEKISYGLGFGQAGDASLGSRQHS
jgi:hypothetical protein